MKKMQARQVALLWQQRQQYEKSDTLEQTPEARRARRRVRQQLEELPPLLTNEDGGFGGLQGALTAKKLNEHTQWYDGVIELEKRDQLRDELRGVVWFSLARALDFWKDGAGSTFDSVFTNFLGQDLVAHEAAKHMLNLTRRQYRRLRAAGEARTRLEADLGREPTVDEIVAEVIANEWHTTKSNGEKTPMRFSPKMRLRLEYYAAHVLAGGLLMDYPDDDVATDDEVRPDEWDTWDKVALELHQLGRSTSLEDEAIANIEAEETGFVDPVSLLEATVYEVADEIVETWPGSRSAADVGKAVSLGMQGRPLDGLTNAEELLLKADAIDVLSHERLIPFIDESVASAIESMTAVRHGDYRLYKESGCREARCRRANADRRAKQREGRE